jgi:hypothetical protein
MSESEAKIKVNELLPTEGKLNCRFEKSNNFQSVFVLGAWGRVSGHGEIILSLYNETPELASNAIYTQAPNGQWAGEPELKFQSGAPGVVREVFVDIVLPLDAAKNVAAALQHWIKVREQAESKIQQNIKSAQ